MDVDHDFIAQSSNLNRAEFAGCVRAGGQFLAEGQEVVHSQESGGGLVHPLHVLWLRGEPGGPGPVRVPLSGQDAVPIPASVGPKSAVKPIGDQVAPLHNNIGREQLIQGERPTVGWHRVSGVEMTNLPHGMRTTVGPARGDDLVLFA